MSKKKNEDITDDIHSESETEELEESNEISDEDRIAELKDTILRLRAELDNSQKRSVAEVEKAHKYGVEKLLVELLPVIDNLEHALNNLSENATKEDQEGIELTLKSFESALDKFGMIPIYPVNEEFNPEKHEAVTMEQDKDKENGSIGNVFQRGWELHSRIVRPARVTVIKN